MKRTIKKILASFLAVTMLLTIAPLTGLVGLDLFSTKAHAEEMGIFTYEIISDNEAIITDCYESASGTITIPTEINGYVVVGLHYSVFSGCNEITSIIIPNTVTSLYSGTFNDCNCITSFSVAEDNPNYCSDERGVLYSKDKTTLIKYPVGNSETEYSIPDSVISIDENAFNNCSSLTSVDFGKNIESIGYCSFYNCYNIESLSLPESLNSIDAFAFAYLNKVENLIIPDSVESIGQEPFMGMDSLKSITLPFINERINSLFGYNNHTSLESITITKQENIPYHAFYNCSNIKSITLPSTIKSIGYGAFDECPNDFTFNCGISLEGWCNISFSGYSSNPLSITHDFVIEGNHITDLVIPDTITNIKPYAFSGADFSSVTFGSSVKTIGIDAFFECNIDSVNFNGSVEDWCTIEFESEYSNPVYFSHSLNIDSESVIDLSISSASKINSYAFINLTDLQTVDLGSNITSIGAGAFENCISLKNIDIPDSATSIGTSAFDGCSSLGYAVLGTGLNKIGENAFSSTGIKHIFYTGTEAQWGYIYIGWGNDAVSTSTRHYSIDRNQSLVSLSGHIIPTCVSEGHDTYRCEICNEEFSNVNGNIAEGHNFVDGVCTKCGWCRDFEYDYYDNSIIITSYNGTDAEVTVPDNMCGIPVVKIDYEAFGNNSYITSVIIPNSVEEIGVFAFWRCQNLKKIELGKNIKKIESAAFAECSSLKVFYHGDLKDWCNISFDDTPSNPCWSGSTLIIDNKEVKELIIPDGVIEIKDNAFCGLSNINKIILPDSVKKIGNCSFSNCSSARIIELSDNLESIGNWAFCDCNSIDHVVIPNKVSYVGLEAFRDSSNIQYIVLGNGIENIGCNAFYGTNINHVFYSGTQSQWNSIYFETNEIRNKGIHYNVDINSNPVSINCINEPDCIHDGKDIYFCNICNSEFSTANISTATGHHYVNGKCENCGWIEGLDYRIEEFDCYIDINGEHYDGQQHSYCFIEGYSGSATELIIPDNICGVPVVCIENMQNANTVKTLVVPESVLLIAGDALRGMDSIESITIPWISVPWESDSGRFAGLFDSSYYYNDAPLPTSLKNVTVTNSTNIPYGEFRNCTNIESVTFEKEVTSVGEDAFLGCSSLKEFNAPNSIVNIGYEAFCNCSSLETISSLSSLISIGNYAFFNCSSLKSISDLNSLTTIGYQSFGNCFSLESVSGMNSLETLGESAFAYCSSLKRIKLPSTIEKIENSAFSECIGLSSIIIPNSVKYIGNYAFEGTSLTELTIPDSVTTIGSRILRYNNTLESLTIPFIGKSKSSSSTLSYILGVNYLESLKTVNITNASIIGNNAFRDCYNIENISLNNGLKTIGSYAFYCCTGLKAIDIPDTVENINDCAFNGCTGLKEINLGNSSNLQINYNVFDRCDNVESYSVGSSSKNYSSDEFGVLYNKNKTGLIKYPAGNSRTEYTVNSNVSYINENAFENSKSLKHVYLPEDIMSIGEYAFRNCTALEEIIIPDGTYTVCYAAFEGCTAIKEITLPEGLTVLGNYAFNGCIALEKVYYNAIELNTDTERDTCFSNCGTESNGIDFIFGESVEIIPDSLLRGKRYYEYNYFAPNVISVTIGSKVKTIGNSAFSNLISLSELNYNAVDCSSGNAAFSGCSSLSNVSISDDVKSIPSDFLTNCDALTDIEIPVSITEIGNFAFSGCDNLERVIFNSSDYIDIGNDILNSSYKAVICCYENSYMHFYAEANILKYCIMDETDNPSFTVRNDVLISYNGTAENVYISSASKIGFGAFNGNETVKSIELSSNVTRIFNQGFKNCSNLEKVIIPKSVTSIGEDAFVGCENVKIWCYPGSYAEAYAVNHEIPVEYIILVIDENRITIGDSESVYLHATYNTEIIDTQSITWSSSDSSVATVSKDGIVTAESFGTAVITATTKDGLKSVCVVNVDVKLKEEVKATISDDIISGDSLVGKTSEEVENMFVNENVSVSAEDGNVGTGDTIIVFNADGEIYKEMTVIIYGDVNGDGVYDGTDSIIVNCLANGLLSKAQVGEAKYMAADCNHDGVIDSDDVALLEQAGIILASVDQTKSETELMTDSAYVEYLSLIDQSPAEEVISGKITTSDEQTSDKDNSSDSTTTETQSAEKTTDSTADKSVNQSLVQKIISVIRYIFRMIIAYIPKAV